MAYETVTAGTEGQNIFATIWTLIDANKPSGWIVVSAFPEDTISGETDTSNFPIIVLDPALIKPNNPTINKDNYFFENIEMPIEYYALSSKGKEQIDIGKDTIRNAILNNATTLDTYKILLKEEPIEDSNNDSFISGKEKINTAAQILKLQIK